MSNLTTQHHSNRVVAVQHAMFAEDFIPTGNSIGMALLCQLYQVDRVRAFARFPNSDTFMLVDDHHRDQSTELHSFTSGFDFHASLYQRSGDSKKPILSLLSENPLIYTTDILPYEEGLSQLAYTPTPNKTISQALICTMVSHANGVMEWMLFEQFQDSPPLSQEDIEELKSLCHVFMVRVRDAETAKQLKEEETVHGYDDLTGLPILRTFQEEVEKNLKANPICALLYLDIDKFKYINDIWSFSTGNRILYEVGTTIATFLEDGEYCCRINDDKFGIYLKFIDDEILERRINTLDSMFVRMQHEQFSDVKITIICGIAVARKSISLGDLLDNANVAHRAVKGSFQNSYKFFDKGLEHLSKREKQLEKHTITALENHEFVPYLQPKFDLTTKKICGAEALARWKMGDRMIEPYEFIPIFERNGFISKMDFEIYDQTFQFIHQSLNRGYDFVPVSLNVSRGYLNDNNFLEKFLRLMDMHSIPAELVELELTESIFCEDNERLKQFIATIRSNGINVSIDDFGSAYSSLNLLKDIDVDTVKLDKAFIDNISNRGTKDSRKDKIIIQNIVNMINDLGFKTIFEGIEFDEQATFLKDSGCHFGQGYIFARPVPLEEFEEMFLKPTLKGGL